jgi:pimeloyl-ACP methyl ester carboxylesterase
MANRARVRAQLTIAIVLVSAIVATAVACGGPPQSREVSFPTADGGIVFADLYAASSSPDAVVLAHGAAFDKASWAPFASWLAGRGHDVLAIDFRGYGRSTAGTPSPALFEDVLGAVRYLHGRGVTRVAVLGASMGGGAAAEAAVRATPGEIYRIVLLSPVPIADPEHLPGPVFFIASKDEPMVAQIREQYRRVPEPKRLVLLSGAAHGQHIFATKEAEHLRTAIAEFLERREAPREMRSCGVRRRA